MKWKLLLVAMLAFSCLTLDARTVGYSYKGCAVKYNVIKEDNAYYIIATSKSETMSFADDPIMKVRTFTGDVLELNGVTMRTRNSNSSGVISGNVVISSTSIISTARFPVSSKEFSKLKNGVQKIRLSMIPYNHEREFKKDKIGNKLYHFYLEAMTSGTGGDF